MTIKAFVQQQEKKIISIDNQYKILTYVDYGRIKEAVLDIHKLKNTYLYGEPNSYLDTKEVTESEFAFNRIYGAEITVEEINNKKFLQLFINYYRNRLVSFSGDKKELTEFISKETGYEPIKVGRSGFAARNSINFSLVYKKEKRSVFDFKKQTFEEKEVEVIDIPKSLIVVEKIEAAKEKFYSIKNEEISNKINSIVGDFGYIEYGGYTGFSYSDIENAGYYILFGKRISNTQDSRQNITHTYKAYIISKKFKGGKLYSIVDSDKGMAIGKGGKNIKKAQEVLKIRISV